MEGQGDNGIGFLSRDRGALSTFVKSGFPSYIGLSISHWIVGTCLLGYLDASEHIGKGLCNWT